MYNAAQSNGTNNFNPYQTGYQTENRVIYEQPGMVLKPLPFYEQIAELIRPAGLISDGVPDRQNDSQVEFKLTIEQADMLAWAPETKRLLLRFCYLDTSCEQDDNFPPDVSVMVNNSSIQLPPATINPNKPNVPAKRPGQHVDITKQCKLCHFVPNVISVKWFVDKSEPSRSYIINVVIAEKLTTETLLQRIRDRGLMDLEKTKKLIVDSDNNNEVATMNLQTSLLCPLGKMKMTLPCKATTCQHIPCFDASVYLQMNEKRASWDCPICYKPAYFRDLMVDGFFMDILSNTDSNVTEVTLNLDGSWAPIIKMDQPVSAKNPAPEVITISDDDD